MTFKDLQRQDILDIFINPDEFGELHEVNGKKWRSFWMTLNF